MLKYINKNVFATFLLRPLKNVAKHFLLNYLLKNVVATFFD
jgi:hypothetical protein